MREICCFTNFFDAKSLLFPVIEASEKIHGNRTTSERALLLRSQRVMPCVQNTDRTRFGSRRVHIGMLANSPLKRRAGHRCIELPEESFQCSSLVSCQTNSKACLRIKSTVTLVNKGSSRMLLKVSQVNVALSSSLVNLPTSRTEWAPSGRGWNITLYFVSCEPDMSCPLRFHSSDGTGKPVSEMERERGKSTHETS